jgi:hypothetical protein
MSYRDNLLALNGELVIAVENFLKEKGLNYTLNNHEMVKNSLGYVRLLLNGATALEKVKYKLIKKYLTILLDNKQDTTLLELKDNLNKISNEKFDYFKCRAELKKTHKVRLNLPELLLTLSSQAQRDVITRESVDKVIVPSLQRQYRLDGYDIIDITCEETEFDPYRITVKYYQTIQEAEAVFNADKQQRLCDLRNQINKREKFLQK